MACLLGDVLGPEAAERGQGARHQLLATLLLAQRTDPSPGPRRGVAERLVQRPGLADQGGQPDRGDTSAFGLLGTAIARSGSRAFDR